MGLFSHKKPSENVLLAKQPAAPVATQSNGEVASGVVNLSKGDVVCLTKQPAGVFTLITAWGEKDYDLYALVEYIDGHVETVSCFGTTRHPNRWTTRTKDNAVVHVTGDKTAYGDDLPQEVISVTLNPQIKTVVPVVYSAKNSGTGSFHDYKVSTHVIEGPHDVVLKSGSATRVEVLAQDASRDPYVYTFVPAVIHNGVHGATVENVGLYSQRSSELRPTVSDGRVHMDSGPENSSK